MIIALTDTEISKISRISPRLGENWGGPGEILRPDSDLAAQNP